MARCSALRMAAKAGLKCRCRRACNTSTRGVLRTARPLHNFQSELVNVRIAGTESNFASAARPPMVAEKTYADFRPADIRRRLKYFVELTSIAIIYVALAKLSLALASIHPSATPI